MIGDLTEINFSCLVNGPTVMAFDGRVLERFSLSQDAQGLRYHGSMFALHLHDPDRKGNSILDLRLNGIMGGLKHWVPGQFASVFEPLMAACGAAGIRVSRGQ